MNKYFLAFAILFTTACSHGGLKMDFSLPMGSYLSLYTVPSAILGAQQACLVKRGIKYSDLIKKKLMGTFQLSAMLGNKRIKIETFEVRPIGSEAAKKASTICSRLVRERINAGAFMPMNKDDYQKIIHKLGNRAITANGGIAPGDGFDVNIGDGSMHFAVQPLEN